MTKKLFISIYFVALSITVGAQVMNKQDLEFAKKKLQLEREAVFIEALHLSISQATVFHSVYVGYDREKRNLDDLFITAFMNYASSYDSLDTKIMRNFIRESSRHQRKELRVRKKYYNKIGNAISREIAAQFYEVDDFTSTILRLNLLTGLPFTGNILDKSGN